RQGDPQPDLDGVPGRADDPGGHPLGRDVPVPEPRERRDRADVGAALDAGSDVRGREVHPRLRLTLPRYAGTNSSAPMSTIAVPLPSPSIGRVSPSMSPDGPAALLPASIAGDPCWRWNLAANSGSAEMFPCWPVRSEHSPPYRAPPRGSQTSSKEICGGFGWLELPQ